MKTSEIIKKQLEKIGNAVSLSDGGVTTQEFKAYIYPLWRRKSSAFEPAYTEVGPESREYYLYIGPSKFDITALSAYGEVLFNGFHFSFTRRDSVKCGNEIIYYTGILKKIKEGEYDEYSFTS